MQYIKYSDCELCHGAGTIECSRCHGTKKDGHCHSCHGSGRKEKCKSCNGAGDVPCSACEGSGYDYDVEPPVKCKVCGGSGRQPCKSCSGTGKTKCKDCNGTGDEICHVCNGDGVVQCPKCEERAKVEAEKKRQAKIKAAEEREERIAAEKRRVQRKADLCRGLWWFLFRVAAAGVYFACLKDCYRDIPDDAVTLLAVGFFVASYIIRPKFGGGVCYFLVGLALPIAAQVYNSTNPMASFCLFTVMVTFFMRWMGEKLKFPLLTYPLVGAMVGFCTSPFAISHNVYNVTPWCFSVVGLSILFFLVNMGMSGNNGNGVVVKGARKTSWSGTFWIFGICGIISWYIFVSANGEPYKFKWQPDEEKQTVKSEEWKLSMYEQGVRFRDGDGVSKNMEMAKKMFSAVNGSNANEQDVVNAEIALGKILIDEGKTDEALKHLKSAAERGSAEAYFLLGEMLQKAGNLESAIKLYQTAADKGFVGAMMVLGQYYSEKTGFLGGRRDKNLAVKYYMMAANDGNVDAKIALNELGD